MKTLPKQITVEFFQTPNGYAELITRWGALVHDPEQRTQLTCAHHLLYMILRGKNWQTAITPITNQKKLDNGAYYAWAGRLAINQIRHLSNTDTLLTPFADLLRDDTLPRICEVVTQTRWNEDLFTKEPYVD